MSSILLQPWCSRCSSGDHHTVSCPQKRAFSPLSNDDSVVASLLIQEGVADPPEQQEYLARLHLAWLT
jgi:hypothetical protein